MANEPLQKYFDNLLTTYDILTEAVAKASERGLKISQQFATEVVAGQREAIALGKKLASEPTDVGQFYTAVLEATTAAQGRALTFAQANYQEALDAGTEARETFEKLVAANKETAESAIEAARSWAGANPMADALRRSWEAFNPETRQAEKAGV
jgi:hypothetical protein